MPEVGAGTQAVEVAGGVVGVDGCALAGREHETRFRPFRSRCAAFSSLPCAVGSGQPVERQSEVERSPRLLRLQVPEDGLGLPAVSFCWSTGSRSRCSCRHTCTRPVSRWMSDQERPSASPRRIPNVTLVA